MRKYYSNYIDYYRNTGTDILKISRKIILQRIFAGNFTGSARKFHAYCIGMPRSGTHSLGRMFATQYRSAHEPKNALTINQLLSWLSGKYNDRMMKSCLKRRDLILNLEMEASHFMHYVVKILVDIFPRAKFILTVRDPLTWLESEINQNIRTQNFPNWRALEEYRYGHYGYKFEKDEETLKNIDNVYPISSYLSYWRDHNSSVINEVPRNRLLVIRTNDIERRINDFARFIGIEPHTVDSSYSHSGQRPRKLPNLFESLNRDFLIEKIQYHCAELIKRHFPELDSNMSYYKRSRLG